jgi:exopolysaccharide production protein ExoQ
MATSTKQLKAIARSISPAGGSAPLTARAAEMELREHGVLTSHKFYDVSDLSGILVIALLILIGFDAYTLGPRSYGAAMTLFAVVSVTTASRGRLANVVFPIWPTAFVLLGVVSRLWTFNIYSWGDIFFRMVPAYLAVLLAVGVLSKRAVADGVTLGLVLVLAACVKAIATSGAARINVDLVTGALTPGWRGSFGHKNTLAVFCVIAIPLTVIYVRNLKLRYVLGLSWVALILLSRSSTGLIGMVLLSAVALLVYAVNRSKHNERLLMGVVLSFFFAIAGFILYELQSVLLAGLGKDATLTGRTKIWNAVRPVIRQRPLFGFGMGGVWQNQGIEPTLTITKKAGFVIFHAHNFYFENALHLGWVGVALLICALISAILTGLRTIGSNPRQAWFALSVGVGILVMGVSEPMQFGIWPSLIALAILNGRAGLQPEITDGRRRFLRAAGLSGPITPPALQRDEKRQPPESLGPPAP